MMTDPADTFTPEGTASEPEDAVRDAAPAEATPRPEADPAVEGLQAEVASLKDRVLRTMAEMENLRRRTEREVADAKSYGVTSFAREMVAVVDNLQRAMVDQFDEGMVLKPAVKYQRVAQSKGVPRDNH